jgi:ribosome maturation factor RimP
VGALAHFFHFQGSMTGIAEQPIAERVRRLLEPIVARDGFELVDVEWQREGASWVLRIYVDKAGGVNVDHCQALSRTIEPVLDVEDIIEPTYSLEVSSPGVERPLRKPEHFRRFAGERAHVKTFGPIESLAAGPQAGATGRGPRKNWTGVLKGFQGGAVEIEVEGELHRIPLDQIAKAHLEYDFDADLRRKE